MTNYTAKGTYPYPAPTDAVTDYPATAATFAGYVDNLPNKNAMINGFFDIWQRGTTPATTVSGSYTADRWRLDWDGTGGTRTVSALTPGLGTSIGGIQPNRVGQVSVGTATTGGSFMRFSQRIEGVRSLAGETATLSFYVLSTTAPKTITVRAVQNFGTGGSPSSAVTTTIGTTTTTTDYVRKSFSFTVPALTGKTIGTNGNDYLEIHFDLGTQTGVYNFWGVQLEQNSTATALEREPLAQTIAKCQRYYEKSYDPTVAPGTSTTVGAFFATITNHSDGTAAITVPFRVSKSRVPDMLGWTTGGTANNFTYTRSGVAATNAAASFSQTGTGSSVMFCQTGATWVAATIQGHWTASAEL